MPEGYSGMYKLLDDSGNRVRFRRRSALERMRFPDVRIKRTVWMFSLVFVSTFFLIFVPALLAIVGSAYNGFAGAAVLYIWILFVLPLIPFLCVCIIVWYHGPDLLRSSVIDYRRSNGLCGACGYMMPQTNDDVDAFSQCPECGAKWRMYEVGKE